MSEIKALELKTEAHLTEMGIAISVHSKEVNLQIEIDLDQDPQYTLALLQIMPRIIEDKLEEINKGLQETVDE